MAFFPLHARRSPSGWPGLILGLLLCAVSVAALAATDGSNEAPAARAQRESASDLSAVVHVRARIPPDARSAETLGTTRAGTGVVIDGSGLVLTIGYLVMEAASIEVTGADNRTLPATLVAYDYATGFGLIRPLIKLDAAPLELGDSSALTTADVALVATRNGYSLAQVVSRRNFAGYWEYLLENAIFTAPARPDFGGAALIGRDGKLLGIGSLFVPDAAGPQTRTPGNMFVPVEALKPILRELVANGRTNAPARPWLGFSLALVDNHVVVFRVSPEGPADQAGIQPGDVIEAVGDEPVANLESTYRAIWARGDAGVTVPLKLVRQSGRYKIDVPSIDRATHLKPRPTF